MEDHFRESTPLSHNQRKPETSDLRNSHTDMKIEKVKDCAPVTEQDHEESPHESASKSFNETG